MKTITVQVGTVQSSNSGIEIQNTTRRVKFETVERFEDLGLDAGFGRDLTLDEELAR